MTGSVVRASDDRPGVEPVLRRTALHDLHVSSGARMVTFAGYEMPLSYRPGAVAEHRHTRASASLFDVAHMGVVELHGRGAAEALEALVPAGVTDLPSQRLTYSFLLGDDGGVLDDVMVTNHDTHLTLVVNASRKAGDLELLRRALEPGVEVRERSELGVLALQGPLAVAVLADRADPTDRAGPEAPAGPAAHGPSATGPGVAGLAFLQAGVVGVAGRRLAVSRSGYTGEDGVELLVGADDVVDVATTLLADPRVELAGLAARDSLRLEAGLCLYGSDLDETTTPVEAGLAWAIPKRRRAEGGFPGWDVIARQLDEGVSRRRVGILPESRRLARPGATVHDPAGRPVGSVTSGGFGATLDRPVAMGYVDVEAAAVGTPLLIHERAHELACRVAALPFVPHRYVRAGTPARP